MFCALDFGMGWEGIQGQPAKTNAGEELVRGREACSNPAKVIAAGHQAFAAGAAVTTNFDPFFWLFLVPGALLAVAAWD